MIDGNYGGPLKGQVAKQAETIVYVNMPWRVLFWRTFWRSIARAYDKRIICGENTESWRKSFFSSDSLLWYLIRNRSRYGVSRTKDLRGWGSQARMIELDGVWALDEFYGERGLSR